MCGRFTLTTPASALALAFGLEAPEAITPRYNIAPTQVVAIIRAASSARRLTQARWGLIPSWAKDAAIGARLINARAETVAEKPSFRRALRAQRCLIPADGFFEWSTEGRTKQPYLIRLAGAPAFGFAGLWESWRPPDGGAAVESCTIVTTEAHPTLRRLHDRMPVILPPESHGPWLDPDRHDPEEFRRWLVPCTWAELTVQPVSRLVNDARRDGPECLSAP